MSNLRAVSGEDSRLPLPPTSGLENADRLIEDLGNALDEILALSGVQYNDINARSSDVVFVGWNKSQWTPLPDKAAPHVGQAREAFRRLHEFSSNAVRRAPDRADELNKLETTIERIIEQPNGSYPGGAPRTSIEEVRGYVNSKLNEYRDVMRRLPSAHGTGERFLVVDTSAVLDRPDLQNWKLDGTAWTVVLLPQLHSELDDRKHDPRTREPARKVINQIEEFDRRGDTFVGVPLAGNLTVREVPISPDMTRTLPWLRPDVPDDAFIAGALELTWQDLTSRIAMTASDRNVRNKARLAGLGVVHPTAL